MPGKLISNLLIILCAVFVIDFTTGRILRYFYFHEESGLHYRTTYSMDSTKADILIIGSSRANHHYVPSVFEDSIKKIFYNAGRDGNGTFYQLALIKTIFKRYTPKIIIFDYSSVFVKSAEEYDQMASLLPYYSTHKEIRSLVELRSPLEKIKLFSEIYPFNSQLLTIAAGNLEMNKKRVADTKGYVPLYREWPFPLDSIPDQTFQQIDTVKVNAFRECLNISKKSGVQVFVVCSPIFQKYNINQQIDMCKQICNEQGIPFWDFSKDTFFLTNKQLFKDQLHLNDKGAIIFSNIIASKIKHY